MNSYSNKRNSNDGTIKNYLSFLYVLLVLISFYPYEFYSAYPFLFQLPEKTLYLIYLATTLGLIVLVTKKHYKIPPVLLIIVLLHLLGIILNNLYKGRAIGVSDVITSLLAIILVYYLNATCGMTFFIRKYNVWICMMTLMGAISVFLVREGILNPIVFFIDLSDDEIMMNYGLTFAIESSDFYYCGFFDERGTVAQWSLFALIFNKLFIKNNKLELFLIITTMFSFSMGYYLQLAVYLLFFHVFEKKHNKKYSFILFLIIVIGGSVMVSDSEIYEKTIGRATLAIDDSKTQGLAIDDRENLTIEAISEFQHNPLFGTSKENPEVGNNIFEPLALYGIVGTFFLYFPFIILFFKAIRSKDVDLLKCMLVIVIGFTHRPFHKNLLSYFIIYSLVAMSYNKTRLNYESKDGAIYNSHFSMKKLHDHLSNTYHSIINDGIII